METIKGLEKPLVITKKLSTKTATLVFVVRDGKLLLATKKYKIGAGKLNGYGGKPHDAENGLRDCAQRELQEESGLSANLSAFKYFGVVDFFLKDNDTDQPTQSVFIYKVDTFEGEPVSTREMSDPNWYDIKNIPFDRMMPADKEFLPLVLDDVKVNMEIRYLDDENYTVHNR